MRPLGTPVLALAIDAVSKVEGEDALCSLLSLFSKCRESLQDGPRLENMVWRLWHRERLACCFECPTPLDCSCPGAVASTFSDTSLLSSDDSALASSDEDQGDHNKVSQPSRSPSTSSRATPSLAGSNGSRRTKRPSRSSAHSHSAKVRVPSSSSLPRSESCSRSRRPSLLPHRTHSNTSVGKIMVDLLPEKLVVRSSRNSLSSPIESERRTESTSSVTLAGSDVPAVVVMSDGSKGASDGVHSRLMSPVQTSSGPTRAPTVVIVNPTPHPTPPMTPHVQSPQHSTQDAAAHANRYPRDNLVVPSRGTVPAQVSSSTSSSSTTLAETSSSSSLRPKPGIDTVANAPVGTGSNGNGIGPGGANGAKSTALAAASGSGDNVGAAQLSEHLLLIHPRHSHLQNKHSSNSANSRGQLQASTSASMGQQQSSHRDTKFFIARHAGSLDGDSPDTSGSSHVGSHSQTMSVSNCTGEPGTSVASGISGISAGTSAVSEVSESSNCTTSQSPSVSHRGSGRSASGQSDKNSRRGEMHIQTPHHPKPKSSKGSTSMGSASGSDVLRMKTKKKGKESRFGFGRPTLTRTQSGFRQGNQQQQALYQVPVQQQQQPLQQQPQQAQEAQTQTHAARTVGKLLTKVASGYQLNMVAEKVNGVGVQGVMNAGAGAGVGAGPTAAVAGPSRAQAGCVKTPISPRHHQTQVQPNASRQQQSTTSANGAVASSSKARIELNEYSDDESDDDWEDESSALSGDVTEDGDAKSTRSTKPKEDAKKAGLLKEAAKEVQRQTDMFAKVDRRSYTNLNRTQSGLLSTIFHPDPSRFPQGHPYRQTRSTHDILALTNRRFIPPYTPSPLPQAQGKGALAGPVAAAVTTEMSQSPSKGRSKLRLKGCPEGEMESSGEEDTENTIPMSTSLAAQKLAELQNKSRRQQQQQPQAPAGYQPHPPSPLAAENPQAPHVQAMPMGFALGYPYELLPPPVPPSTPRTTRRNMLKKELPESLRRNLLWERQVSKHGPIGLGNGPAAARRVTAPVTGNGTGTGNGNVGGEGDDRTARALSRKHTWEDEFHVAGW